MFLPMSCTSPLTVASTIVPLPSSSSGGSPAAARSAARAAFSASRYGSRYATAFFITRALLITCGRNILPAPKRSPTTFMPSISGPSITSSGVGNICRASSMSASTNSEMPLISGCVSRSATAASRHASLEAAAAPPPPPGPAAALRSFSSSANLSRRSTCAPSALRLSTTSSTYSRIGIGMSE